MVNGSVMCWVASKKSIQLLCWQKKAAAFFSGHLEAPPPKDGADRTRGVTVLPRTTRGSNMMFIGGIDRSAGSNPSAD